MGIYDQLNPSLIPQTNYGIPDYSSAYENYGQNLLNNTRFGLGLQMLNSSNSILAMNGRNMVDDSLTNKKKTQFYNPNLSTGTATNPDGSTDYWNSGFNALSNVGQQLGGLAGNVLTNASKLGSGIKMITDANKGLKTGLEGASKAKAGGIGAVVGAASDMIGSFMPQKSEYSGTKGDLTLTLDSTYDAISDAAMSFGPIGMAIGGIMKGGAMLGKGMNALGGGTDGMTTTDAILGSSFLNLTPIGLINGFGGSKTQTFTKDDDAFAQVGSSYTGSDYTTSQAAMKAGKKYGLFSQRAKENADNQISEAKRQQSIILDISQDVQDRTNIRTSMSAINGNRRALQMQGGYDLSAIRFGRHGMPISILNRTRQIIKALNGTKLNNTESDNSMKDYVYGRFPILKNISFELLNDNNFLPRRDLGPQFGDIEYINQKYDDLPYYNNYSKPDKYKGKSVIVYNNNAINEDVALDVLSHGLRELDSYWSNTIIPSLKKEWDNYIFDEGIGNYSNKSPQEWKLLPRKEKDKIILGFYKSEDYDNIVDGLVRLLLVKPELRKLLRYSDDLNYIDQLSNTNAWKLALDYINTGKIPQHKNGGTIIKLVKESVIDLVNPNDILEFKNGGSMNVIPEGALHARKHNIELDGITEKGIPVIDNSGKQQAEVEKEEIILRLEVTLKLEKYEKKYYDEETSLKEKDELALKAGELITKEILHNTKDNAGLL